MHSLLFASVMAHVEGGDNLRVGWLNGFCVHHTVTGDDAQQKVVMHSFLFVHTCVEGLPFRCLVPGCACLPWQLTVYTWGKEPCILDGRCMPSILDGRCIMPSILDGRSI